MTKIGITMRVRILIIICVAAVCVGIGLRYFLRSRTDYTVVIKTDTHQPQSYLAVYKNSKLIYRFAPVVPDSVGYPRPLELENAQRVGSYIVTNWGETGADYFGTHPILISLKGNSCRAVQIYDKDLSEDARIKDYSWTRKDFFVTNYFDPSEKVKTILAQGVAVTQDKKLELSFFADEKPHVANHEYAKINLFALL
ncbi:MAG: hypothetical protein HY761_09345 [Candidatus Omnitrophica bacterium]|nr:hypothetical protein [Candidatus Omnitrophota bacterium]